MRYILVITLLLLQIQTAFAGYIEDVRNLGYVSGEGLACNAERYKIYELIARAYLISAASSDKEQNQGMYEYNNAKATAYLAKRHDGLLDCAEINQRFNNQKIFNTKVYEKGKLKMPDGKIIKPRVPYDVTQVYDNKANEKEKLDEHFERVISQKRKQAQEEGIYEKIRQIEMNLK